MILASKRRHLISFARGPAAKETRRLLLEAAMIPTLSFWNHFSGVVFHSENEIPLDKKTI